MVVNSELEKALFDSLCYFAGGDFNRAAALIQDRARVVEDTPYKLKVMVGGAIGYGYDFTKPTSHGQNSRQIYEQAVENTISLSGGAHVESFVGKRVVDDRFGIYVTSLQRMA